VQTQLREHMNHATATARQSLDSAAASLNESKAAQWLRYWGSRHQGTSAAPEPQHEEESSSEAEQAAVEQEDAGVQAVEDIQSWVESVEHCVQADGDDHHVESAPQSEEDTGEAELDGAQPGLREEWMEHLRDLVEMGFDEGIAQVELARCDGNVRLAVKALVAAEREAKA